MNGPQSLLEEKDSAVSIRTFNLLAPKIGQKHRLNQSSEGKGLMARVFGKVAPGAAWLTCGHSNRCVFRKQWCNCQTGVMDVALLLLAQPNTKFCAINTMQRNPYSLFTPQELNNR
jgi:hypothetical protein